MASRSIGSIYAELTLRDGGFQRGMKSARKSLNDFGSKAVAAGAAGVAVFGAALTAGTIRTLDQVDALADLSSQTGVAIGDMMILQRAYKDGGREADMAGKDIGKMQKNIVAAASGGNDPFSSIGLSAEKLLAMNPSDQFNKIGSAIMRISNPAERTAKAMEIFGKGGMGLITVFGGIEDARQTLGKWPGLAEKFGGAMGRANDIIGQLPAKADAFFGGFTAGIIGELLPNLEKLKAVDFTEIGQNLGAALATAFQSITDGTMWELFKLHAEKAMASLQTSPAINGLAAHINTVIENPLYGAGVVGTLLPGYKESMDKYKQLGVDANTGVVDDLQIKIDEINKIISDKYKVNSDAAAAMGNKNTVTNPITDLSAIVTPSQITQVSDTAPSRMNVNDYQRRGLSLDGGGMKDVKLDKMIKLMTDVRDSLKRMAEGGGQLVW